MATKKKVVKPAAKKPSAKKPAAKKPAAKKPAAKTEAAAKKVIKRVPPRIIKKVAPKPVEEEYKPVDTAKAVALGRACDGVSLAVGACGDDFGAGVVVGLSSEQ